jgi:hypothetical protein
MRFCDILSGLLCHCPFVILVQAKRDEEPAPYLIRGESKTRSQENWITRSNRVMTKPSKVAGYA